MSTVENELQPPPSDTPQLVSIAAGEIVTQVAENVQDEDCEQDTSTGEPEPKRIKIEGEVNITKDQSLKQIMFNINKAICIRLDSIENQLQAISQRHKYLEDKVEQVLSQTRQNGNPMFSAGGTRRGAVIVGLPQNGKVDGGGDARYAVSHDPASNQSEDSQASVNSGDNGVQNLGPNVTLITLNTEDDYPTGTWLGEEGNPEMRVRVPITPSDLLHVHSNCRTPEKMALTLLDYLFDRETQATSNLSGMGKHGKRQLDPLMIYGIRCHLIHKFGISENDWHRIKQNIDSKCRTAFRRKQRGMPLTGDVDIQAAVAMQGEAIQQGEIQILHATPEQISQLQHAHHIQILQGDQVIGQIQSGDVANISGLPDGIQVATVTTESGEVLHIQQTPNAASSDQQD